VTAVGLLSYRTSLPAAAYGARPLTVDEIDAHPDSARIWATISHIRQEHSRSDDRDYPSHLSPGADR